MPSFSCVVLINLLRSNVHHFGLQTQKRRNATVGLSWPEFTAQCKSRLSALARSLYLSRSQLEVKCNEFEIEIEERDLELASKAAELQERNELIASQAARIRVLEDSLAKAKARDPAVRLADDPPLFQHQFGGRMISLSVNLASKIGLRAAEKVLEIIWDWLGVKSKIPTWQAIRGWMQRVGLARLTDKHDISEQSHWLADHSIQIGREKVLLVVGVRKSNIPERGQALRHQDLDLLALAPGTSWKAEDVGEVYKDLEKKFGTPKSISSDAAVELQDAAEFLKNGGKRTIVFRDPKHFFANRFESLIGKAPRFTEFIKHVTNMRSAVQQTDLAHLAPPSLKPKSRFMNMEPLLNWAMMALWQLDNPTSKARKGVTNERLESKLGWLLEFREEIKCWWGCQQAISIGVTLIAENGIFCGASDEFVKETKKYTKNNPTCLELVNGSRKFLEQYESKLKKGERLPMSTEIVESSFGLFKQLEGQQSKGGFTQLIIAFGALLKPSTPESIREDFERVKVKDVNEWLNKNLPATLSSKRQSAYREYRQTEAETKGKRATEAALCA